LNNHAAEAAYSSNHSQSIHRDHPSNSMHRRSRDRQCILHPE
jgi:hypothetical protein